MSRPSTSSTRQLTLTEELEKLEQSITLTLQEIDHNFSRAHRIVTSSILPIVEQYAEHSNAVWDGSKFWKQFFEASANVSLSGVEERDGEDEDASSALSHDNASTYADSTSLPEDDTLQHRRDDHDPYSRDDDSLLDNGDISGSTPRAPRSRGIMENGPNFASYSSPYEELKKDMIGPPMPREDTEFAPSTPSAQSRIPDMSMTSTSSPFEATRYMQSAQRPGVDPLLHRVLDKNYRIHATPHTAQQDNKTPANKPSWRDSTSPMSSPPVAAPKLHAEIFDSPIRQQYSRPSALRTPGISVQTPAKKSVKDHTANDGRKDEISWESDSDEDAEDVYKGLGMSPPKTIQFSLPQTKLLQTPAREASRQIVEDLLTTAGAGFDETDELENSPSMVAMKDNLDDTF